MSNYVSSVGELEDSDIQHLFRIERLIRLLNESFMLILYERDFATTQDYIDYKNNYYQSIYEFGQIISILLIRIIYNENFIDFLIEINERYLQEVSLNDAETLDLIMEKSIYLKNYVSSTVIEKRSINTNELDSIFDRHKGFVRQVLLILFVDTYEVPDTGDVEGVHNNLGLFLSEVGSRISRLNIAVSIYCLEYRRDAPIQPVPMSDNPLSHVKGPMSDNPLSHVKGPKRVNRELSEEQLKLMAQRMEELRQGFIFDSRFFPLGAKGKPKKVQTKRRKTKRNIKRKTKRRRTHKRIKKTKNKKVRNTKQTKRYKNNK